MDDLVGIPYGLRNAQVLPGASRRVPGDSDSDGTGGEVRYAKNHWETVSGYFVAF